MRYLQIAIPVLIVLITVAVLTRRNASAPPREDVASDAPRSDTGVFVLILVIGAIVAAIAFFVIGEFFS